MYGNRIPLTGEVSMFGFRFVKVPPTTYVIQFRSGKIVRAGTGCRSSISTELHAGPGPDGQRRRAIRVQ